jgi:hypothetical protein
MHWHSKNLGTVSESPATDQWALQIASIFLIAAATHLVTLHR